MERTTSQVVRVDRPPRILLKLPQSEIELPAPPQLPAPPTQRWSMLLTPLLMLLVYGLMAWLRGGRGGGWLLVVPMIGMASVSIGTNLYTIISQRRSYRRAKAAALAAWNIALNECDQQLQLLWQEQFNVRCVNDPPPLELEQLIKTSDARLWERRTQDADFLALRLGQSEYPSTTMIKLPRTEYTSRYSQQLHKLVRRYRTIKGVPFIFDLRRAGALGVVGDLGATVTLLHALIWHIVTHHSPDDVRIVGFWPLDQTAHWDWLRFLPHTRSLIGDASSRLLAYSDIPLDGPNEYAKHTLQLIRHLERLLRDRQTQPESAIEHLVICIADPTPAPMFSLLMQTIMQRGAALKASLICVSPAVAAVPEHCAAYIDLTVHPAVCAQSGPAGGRTLLHVDTALPTNPMLLAEILGRRSLALGRNGRDLPAVVNLLELLGIDDAQTFDPWVRWRELPPTDDEHPSGLFPVPIGRYGMQPDAIVWLDLNEKREGVHGMIAGTTGSGKSELLTTLLLALAVRHHPDRLNFLLIDFKGGATFRDLQSLPHTAGLVTDLTGSLAERALIAINSELDRRKQQLSQCGVPNIKRYRRLKPTPAPLPNLLIAIDEFDEMARDYPEFIEELIRVAKQGRSLGVHLLFATQTPSNGAIKAGLKTNLSYWIALRVVDPEDSKLMIGSRDAALISNATPGRAYKRVNNTVVAFQSALATMAYRPTSERIDDPFLLFDALGRTISPRQRQRRLSSIRPQARDTVQRSDADLLQEQMASTLPGYAAERYRIWQEPLSADLLLSDVLSNDIDQPAGLQLHIGLIDQPERAQQQPLLLDLATCGSVLVVGGGGVGKTSFMRTSILALAWRYSPQHCHLWLIDALGDGLGFATQQATGALPHLCEALACSDQQRIERLLTELEQTIQLRQEIFAQYGIEDWREYPQASASPLPAIVVFIDTFVEFVEQNTSLLPSISRLLRNGRAYGIYWILTADRMASSVFPADLRNRLGQKIVLRVMSENDSLELLNKPFAARIRADQLGRGFWPSPGRPLEIQIAYPTLRSRSEIRGTAGDSDTALRSDLSSLRWLEVELPNAIQRIQQRWAGAPATARPLRLLANVIDIDWQQWLASYLQPHRFALATEHRSLQPVVFDLTKSPHWLICGGPSTGKSALMTAMLAGVTARSAPSELRLYLFDYRASVLRPFAKLPHTQAYITMSGIGAADDATAEMFCPAVLEQLEAELLELKQAELAGVAPPYRIVLAICNIDLLETSELTQLGRLSRWVVQGRRLGFHVLVSSTDFSAVGSNPMIKMIKHERNVVVLGQQDVNASQLGLGTKSLRWPTSVAATPGRGFWINHGSEQLVQVWHLPRNWVLQIQASAAQSVIGCEPILEDREEVEHA